MFQILKLTVMRRVILIIAAFLFVNLNGVQAKNNVTASNSEKTIRVVIENPASNATILISDVSGTVLHRRHVQKQNYTASFDMKQLPAGKYMLSVSESEFEKVTTTRYSVLIENGLISLGESEVSSVFFPTVVQKENLLFVQLLSLNTDTFVIVKFTDQKGEAVHTDSFTANGSKGRTYSLENLKPGTYTVTTYVEGQTSSSTITVS